MLDHDVTQPSPNKSSSRQGNVGQTVQHSTIYELGIWFELSSFKLIYNNLMLYIFAFHFQIPNCRQSNWAWKKGGTDSGERRGSHSATPGIDTKTKSTGFSKPMMTRILHVLLSYFTIHRHTVDMGDKTMYQSIYSCVWNLCIGTSSWKICDISWRPTTRRSPCGSVTSTNQMWNQDISAAGLV